MSRIPLLPDDSGEPGHALYPEDSAPARSFDEVAAGIAQTRTRKRIKVV